MTLDFCHAFHLGYGMDMGASTIVLLARLGFWGPQGSFPEKLKNGYRRFSQWCYVNKRVTSIKMLSLQDFDMSS